MDRYLEKMHPPKRVLIFMLSGLGDTLMFTPALRLMRLVWNKTQFTALTMRLSEYEILKQNKDLDEVKNWSFLDKSFISTMQFLIQLRREQFDLSILPCPSNRLQYNVIAFLSGAKSRVGFRYLQQSHQNLDFLNTTLFLHEDHVHNVEANLRLAESLTGVLRTSLLVWKPALVLPIVSQDMEEAQHFLESEKLLGTEYIGLHISSSRTKHMERKCWPKEYFLELTKILEEQNPNLRFILFCGEEDLPESEWLKTYGSDRIHVAWKLPIRTAAEVIRSCRLFITNDSGLLHVACAMQTPAVAIFGPTNPNRTGPWMGKAEVVRTGIHCSPCFYHTSYDLTCPARLNFACLRELSVKCVFEAVECLMKKYVRDA